MDNPQEVERLRGEFKRIVTVMKFSERLANTKFDIVKDYPGMLAARMDAYIASLKVSEHQYQYIPDWWNHFKERWFPLWAKRRWPVIYNRVVITVEQLLPSIPYKGPEPSFIIMQLDRKRIDGV